MKGLKMAINIKESSEVSMENIKTDKVTIDGVIVKKGNFLCGYACAVSCLIDDLDEPALGKRVLKQGGFTIEDLEKVGADQYHIDIIKKALNDKAT